jgi:hypothetical protein
VAFLGGHLEGLGQNGFGTPEGKIDWVVWDHVLKTQVEGMHVKTYQRGAVLIDWMIWKTWDRSLFICLDVLYVVIHRCMHSLQIQRLHLLTVFSRHAGSASERTERSDTLLRPSLTYPLATSIQTQVPLMSTSQNEDILPIKPRHPVRCRHPFSIDHWSKKIPRPSAVYLNYPYKFYTYHQIHR